MPDVSLGRQIKGARNKLGLSQEQLAKKIGTSQQNVERWENGMVKPSAKNAARLFSALGINAGINSVDVTVSRPLVDLPLSKLAPEQFQNFCCSLLSAQGHKDAQVYGVSGDKQDGIDVLSNDDAQIVIQCKRVKTFGKNKVKEVAEQYIAGKRQDKEKILAMTKSATRDEQDAADNFGWKIWDIHSLTCKVRELDEVLQRRLMREFFPGDIQVLENCLGLKSPSVLITSDEYFDQFGSSGLLDYELAYHGDTTLVNKVLSELQNDDRTAVVIHGNGGMGKTRLLKELSRLSNKKMLFLQEGIQLNSEFLSEIYNQNAIIVIEDAYRRQEELRVCLALVNANSKLLVTTRSYALEEVKKILTDKNLLKQNAIFEVKKLSLDSARDLVRDIVGDNPLNEQLISIARDNTLILTLGAKALRETRVLPNKILDEKDVHDKIRAFMEEYIGQVAASSKELAQDILGIASLVQPFTNDQNFKQLMQQIAPQQNDIRIDRLIQKLIKLGVLCSSDEQLHIMPDLLGDYVLEDLLTTSPTTVEKIIGNFANIYFNNILQNLCRLDWRTSQKNLASAHLDSLWSKIRQQFLRTPDIYNRLRLIELVEKIAYFQPKQTLEFVKFAVDHNHSAEADEIVIAKALLKVLGVLAHIDVCLPEVIDILAELADKYPAWSKQTHGENPLESLREIATLHRQKLSWYMQMVVDYIIENLFKSKHVFSPFDILDKALATEMTDTIPKSQISFEVHTAQLRPEHTQTFRPQIVKKILNSLTSEDLALAIRAAKSVKNAVQTSQPSRWQEETIQILGEIQKVVQTQEVHPLVLATIYTSINWLAGKDDTSRKRIAEQAQKTLDVIPKTLEFDIALSLLSNDGYSIFFHESSDYEVCQQKYQKWLHELATKIITSYNSDYEAILNKIMEYAQDMQEPLGNYQYTCNPVIAACCEVSCEFCTTLKEAILAKQADIALMHCYFFSMHNTHKQDNELKIFIRKALDSNDVEFIKATISELGVFPEVLSKQELQELYCQVNKSNGNLLSAIYQSLRWLPQEYNELIVTVVHDTISFSPDKDTAQSLVSLLSTLKHRDGSLQIFQVIDYKQLLQHMVHLDSLDEYEYRNILQELCNIDPQAVLQLLFDRIDFAENHRSEDDDLSYHEIPFMTHVDVPVASVASILATLCQQIIQKKNLYGSLYGQRILAYFNIGQKYIMEVVLELLRRPDLESLYVAGAMIKGLSSSLIFNYDDVLGILKAAELRGKSDQEVVEKCIFDTIFNGMEFSSRAIGQPGPTEVKLRNYAEEMVKKAPVGSTISRIYSKVYDYAKEEIEQQRKRDRKLLED